MAHRHDHCSIRGCDEAGGIMIQVTADEARYFCLHCGAIVAATLDIMERRIQDRESDAG